ncbi:hypothetical protein L1887_12449 [Cichorium endivia]|nr:hypothetical protein L1887_12449 [Cichorium endivia]
MEVHRKGRKRVDTGVHAGTEPKWFADVKDSKLLVDSVNTVKIKGEWMLINQNAKLYVDTLVGKVNMDKDKRMINLPRFWAPNLDDDMDASSVGNNSDKIFEDLNQDDDLGMKDNEMEDEELCPEKVDQDSDEKNPHAPSLAPYGFEGSCKPQLSHLHGSPFIDDVNRSSDVGHSPTPEARGVNNSLNSPILFNGPSLIVESDGTKISFPELGGNSQIPYLNKSIGEPFDREAPSKCTSSSEFNSGDPLTFST